MVILKEKRQSLNEGRIKINADILKRALMTAVKAKNGFFDWIATDQANGYKQITTADYYLNEVDNVGFKLSKNVNNFLDITFSNIVEVYLSSNCIDIIFKNHSLLTVGFNPRIGLYSHILQFAK